MLMASAWLLAIRPRTLPASISPIVLGSALAFHHGAWNPWILGLALACALLLQIAVNLANDLFDGRAGIDTAQRLGPLRVTQSGLIDHRTLTIALGVVCLLAIANGLALAALSDWLLVGFGIAALCALLAYSGGPWPLASHGLGELTVLLFFGWLAVAGTHYAHTLTVNGTVIAYATIAGLISAAIMLVNNLRDIPTDGPAGKRTLAVRLGDAASRRLYQILLLGAVLLHLAVSAPLGWWTTLALLPCLPLLWRLTQQIRIRNGRQLNQQLAETALLELLYCLAVGAALLLSA